MLHKHFSNISEVWSSYSSHLSEPKLTYYHGRRSKPKNTVRYLPHPVSLATPVISGQCLDMAGYPWGQYTRKLGTRGVIKKVSYHGMKGGEWRRPQPMQHTYILLSRRKDKKLTNNLICKCKRYRTLHNIVTRICFVLRSQICKITVLCRRF